MNTLVIQIDPELMRCIDAAALRGRAEAIVPSVQESEWRQALKEDIQHGKSNE